MVSEAQLSADTIRNSTRASLLHALQIHMKNILERWNKIRNGESNGDYICHLIEFIIDKE